MPKEENAPEGEEEKEKAVLVVIQQRKATRRHVLLVVQGYNNRHSFSCIDRYH